MKLLLLGILAVGLSGCGSSSSPPPAPPPSASASPWSITSGSSPQRLQMTDGVSYFDFPPACAPTPQDALPCYVSYVEQPYGPIAGKTAVTLSYSITGAAPVFTNLSNGNNCGGPPAISLLIHQAGDNMTGEGAFAFYRWFSSKFLEQPLALGDHTITAPLDDISKWTPFEPNLPGADAGFSTAKANIGRIGFVLGGACFAGHGVAVASGSARFVIKGQSAN